MRNICNALCLFNFFSQDAKTRVIQNDSRRIHCTKKKMSATIHESRSIIHTMMRQIVLIIGDSRFARKRDRIVIIIVLFLMRWSLLL